MPLGGLTSFHSTAKIAPRMHQTSSLSSKIEKFSGEAQQPTPQTPHPLGRGTPLSTPYPPRRLDPRAFGARHSRLRRSVSPAFPVSPLDLGVLAETLEGRAKRRRKRGRKGKEEGRNAFPPPLQSTLTTGKEVSPLGSPPNIPTLSRQSNVMSGSHGKIRIILNFVEPCLNTP